MQVATVEHLLRALRPGGYAGTSIPGMPTIVYALKNDLVHALQRLPPETPASFEVRNPDHTGRYQSPRRLVVLYGIGEAFR